MKRLMKKLLSGVIAITLCLSVTLTAFAATATKSAGKYGTLTGTLSGTTSRVNATTKITRNPDSAYLTITMEPMDISGNLTLDPFYDESNTGATTFSGYGINMPTGTYKVFGTHGVQGGSVNPAYAVYTVTSL